MRFFFIVLCTTIIAALYGCQTENRDSILPEGIVLHDGDVVFRCGRGVTSHVVRNADPEGVFSHVGIIAATDSGMMVIHAVPDEPEFDGDVDRVRAERPESFFSSFKAQSGAISRYPDSVAATVAAQYAKEAYRRHTLFDHEYNDDDTTNLYCCQLVALAYHNAGVELVDSIRHQFSVPGFINTKCILPSDLYNSPLLQKVAYLE